MIQFVRIFRFVLMKGRIRPRQRLNMKTTRFTALAIAPALWLTGCVGILPVPPLSNKPVAGRVIERRDTSFIVPGAATRSEVEQRLRPSSRHCNRAPSVAYSWERPGWTMFWCYGYSEGSFEVGGWHALFVAFDDAGMVRQEGFVNLSDLSSLDEQLERWAERARKNRGPRSMASSRPNCCAGGEPSICGADSSSKPTKGQP